MADPVTEFEMYRQELLAALGQDEPVAVLRTHLEEVPRLVADASDDDLQRAPAPGEWSARDVLNHLADADLIAGIRVRMIVTQDRPTLVGYDQEAWTARFGMSQTDPRATLTLWQALRLANVSIFESLSEAEWQRVGAHTERGEESARLTVELMAGHDRVHMDQIRRCLGR